MRGGVWTSTSIIGQVRLANLNLVLFLAASPVAGHAKETWMSPSTEGLRHHLLKIETEKQDPEIVEEKHSEPVTDGPVIKLSEQVVRIRANLTCFKL